MIEMENPDFNADIYEDFIGSKIEYEDNFNELNQIIRFYRGTTLLQVYEAKYYKEVVIDGETDYVLEIDHNDFLYALAFSIDRLWGEAVKSFIFSIFEGTILICGSIVERTLKLAYGLSKENEYEFRDWSLNDLIINCHEIVNPEILEKARRVSALRNDRIHAIKEIKNPQNSYYGKYPENRNSQAKYSFHTFPFRGEARDVIQLTEDILIFVIYNIVKPSVVS